MFHGGYAIETPRTIRNVWASPHCQTGKHEVPSRHPVPQFPGSDTCSCALSPASSSLSFSLHISPLSARNPRTRRSAAESPTPPKHSSPTAEITAVNAGTNFPYKIKTNVSGEYYLTNLSPGRYRLEVEKTGFRKLIESDVTLHVQDAIELNFELTLGSAAETITVPAGAPLVETESATVSTVIDRTFVEKALPLNGRSFQTLVMLTPGVVVTTTAAYDQGQFSVNGQRADATTSP